MQNGTIGQESVCSRQSRDPRVAWLSQFFCHSTNRCRPYRRVLFPRRECHGCNASDYRNKKRRAIATAIDQTHIVVNIPEEYRETPVQFVSQIERIPLVNIANKKRVYINERNDVIVIGEDVTIAPVAVSYGSLTIAPQNARGGPTGSFVEVNPKDDPTKPKLKNLVDALNVLNVPTKDIVAIIKGIHKQGNMYGELIIE